MRTFVAETTLVVLGLLCSALPSSHAGAPAAGCIMADPADPSVGGDLDGILLRVGDSMPAPATSNRARVAPAPSERNEPGAPEVRQTPAGGETRGKPEGAEEGKHRD